MSAKGGRTSDASPAELVARALDGDAEACTLLVRGHLRAAYAVALAVLRRPADAEDVAQDAFAAAFERLETCRDPARFTPWLLQIVRNRALNVLASRTLRETPVDPELDVQRPPAEDVALRDRLVAALGALTPAQREVVLLHDLEGWTHPEIAEALELSVVNCRQHLFQARRKLRGLLGDVQGTEDDHVEG